MRGLKQSIWPVSLALLTAPTLGVTPAYTADGEFLIPADYREWIFLSAGLDMSYTAGAAAPAHSTFDNVFVDRAAWAGFQATGHWPDGTMFVMEVRAAGSRASINQRGHFQTDTLRGFEIHVHDAKRFQGGWAFFESEARGPARLVPQSEDCYACHLDHGALDTTFTQFYPTAKAVAVKAGTYRER